jgi:uncharacterized RDD family membrane protein YckC
MANQSNQQVDLRQIDFGHWILRFIAFVIDSIIILIPTYIIWFFITVAIVFTGFFLVYGFWLIYFFLFGIIEVLYFTILDVAWGGTVGKRLLGFQVQTTSGGKVDFGKALIRNISKIYWIFLVLDWLIAIVTPGNDRRQKYTDRIAGTTVVQVRQTIQLGTSPAPAPAPSPS